VQQFYCKPQANSNAALTLTGLTLPTATPGVAYTQSIAAQAAGGFPPYTFSLISTSGGDTWFVSVAGVITGTPITGNFRVDSLGNLRVDNLGNQRITT
jgi:hypothetical protein